MGTAAGTAPLRVGSARRLAWRRPEWPWAVAAGAAWIALLAAMPEGMAGSGAHHGAGPVAAELAWWGVMVMAMMVPGTLPIVREVSLQSVWERRYRTAALFVAGYVTVWTVFGVEVLGAWSLIRAPSPRTETVVAGGALLIAGAWGVTAAKRHFLQRCHRFVALPPRGRAGDRACLRFGAYHGRQCVGACWPVMLALVPGPSAAWMAGATLLVSWERLARIPRLRLGALILAAGGTCAICLAG